MALITYETDTRSAWLLTDSAHAALKPAMFRYAKDNLGPDGALKVFINDDDLDFQRTAAGQCLTITHDREPHSSLDLTGDVSYRLPDGYRIASLADDGDLERLNRVLRRGFNNSGEVPTTAAAIDLRRTSVSGPHLNRDLNNTVIAPNGNDAAYCGI